MEIPMDISTWDDKCMQAFIRENASMFRVFAFRYLQDEEAVDDVLQESYMKLWINRSKIGSVKSPRNYFFSIIKNTIADKRDYFPKGRKELVPADVSDGVAQYNRGAEYPDDWGGHHAVVATESAGDADDAG